MQLKKHQQEIIKEDKKKVGLFLGTGSGKTLTALHLARGKTLIIAPKTQVLDKNWERDNVHVNKNITVMSKETFRRDHKIISKYDTVIVDEAHTALGCNTSTKWVNKVEMPRNSQIFEALMTYLNTHKPDRIYLCSATIMKSPMTVLGAYQVLGNHVSFDAWRHFRDIFYIRIRQGFHDIYKIKSDNTSKERLASFVKKMGYIGRLDTFFDVPDQTHLTYTIKLTDEQKQAIDKVDIIYPETLVNRQKRHQIENGVLVGNEYEDSKTFNNGKLNKILEVCYEYKRVIVFAKYTAQINMIAKALEEDGHKVYTLTGKSKDRKELFAQANEEDAIIVAQATMSSGWEVPSYPCIIFASTSYSFVDYDQGLGRIQRLKNIKKNIYIHLISEGVDEDVYKCVMNKKDYNEKLYVEKRG